MEGVLLVLVLTDGMHGKAAGALEPDWVLCASEYFEEGVAFFADFRLVEMSLSDKLEKVRPITIVWSPGIAGDQPQSTAHTGSTAIEAFGYDLTIFAGVDGPESIDLKG